MHGRCGAVLNQSITTLSSGMVNVANSLAVIKKLCFDDKICSVEELQTAIRNNWSGSEALRKKALAVRIGATMKNMWIRFSRIV